MQARRYSSPAKTDVIILCFGLDETARATFLPICEAEDIVLTLVDTSRIEHQSAMMARFFLNDLVSPTYTDYLYLDGDIHILGSLEPLLDADVPDGHFLAANDPMTFLLVDSTSQSRDLADHLRSLGLTLEQSLRYFNSGVLRIKSKGWEEIGKKAWEKVRRSQKVSRFPDQDILNIVAMDRRLPMSLTWNYPVFMRNALVEKEIQPRIKHFMSSPKPWEGAFPPWTADECLPYADALQRYPSLEPYSIRMAAHYRTLYQWHQRRKQVSELMTWGFGKRRARILNYENTCFIPARPTFP